MIRYLRACLKSFSLSQKTLIFEHRSAVYIEVNEQRSAKNQRFMAKIGDFKQALIIFLALSMSTAHAKEILNIYIWSGYIPDSVLAKFQEETGISVNYSTYDSNETLYAKLKTNPDAGYDVIVPSTYFIDRMKREGMLSPLDKSKIQNFKNLNPALLNKPYDPGNQYSIPYFWGTTGLVINKHYFSPQNIKAWKDLWNPTLKDKVMLLDDMREVFSMALLSLGYPANDTDLKHIQQAYVRLRELLPNVRLFNAGAQKAIYIDEDATIGMGWNGDIYLAAKENSNIDFIYPEEGFVIWIDNLAIPNHATHLENAYKFINFVLRPDIAKQICLGTGYTSPNLAAVKLLPPAIRDNPIIYPDANTLKRGQVQTDVGEAVEIYEKYWELLKLSA